MHPAADPAQVTEAFYAAYNRGDVDAAMELYAPDAEHVEVAQGRVAKGRDEIRSGLEGFLRSFPDARWERSSARSSRASKPRSRT